MGGWWWIKLAGRNEQQLCFRCLKQSETRFRDDLGKPDILSSAWLHRLLAGLLTIHYVEYECQHRATGGGVWDIHGVVPNVQLQGVFIQHRLVLQQIIQGDNTTWSIDRGVRGSLEWEKITCFMFIWFQAYSKWIRMNNGAQPAAWTSWTMRCAIDPL